MVHGSHILSRYVLVLKRPIHKYNHLMDIMKSCHHDLELIGEGKKIVVFNGHWLNERRYKDPSLLQSNKIMNNLQTGTNYFDFDSPRGSFEECKWSNEHEKLVGDVHGWFDVLHYSLRKFDMHEEMAKFDEEEWRKLGVEVKKSDTVCDAWETYRAMTKTARLIHMHKNPEYLAKVKELEGLAATLPLTLEEQNVLGVVKSSPHLQDIIEQEGFEMYIEHY